MGTLFLNTKSIYLFIHLFIYIFIYYLVVVDKNTKIMYTINIALQNRMLLSELPTVEITIIIKKSKNTRDLNFRDLYLTKTPIESHTLHIAKPI